MEVVDMKLASSEAIEIIDVGSSDSENHSVQTQELPIKNANEPPGNTNSHSFDTRKSNDNRKYAVNCTQDLEQSNLDQNKYFNDREIHDNEITVELKGYGCAHCSYLSTSRQHIKHHIRFTHRNPDTAREYQCPFCPKKAIGKKIGQHIYNRHTRTKEDWMQCGHCVYKTKYKGQLTTHIQVKHFEMYDHELKRCKECGKGFKTQEYLKRHLKSIHHPETTERLKCYNCKFTTKTKNNLQTHMLLHKAAPKEGIPCTKCDFRAKDYNEMNKHRYKEHFEWKQCHLCPYKSRHIQHLKLHLIHHQKKEEDLTFKCDKCDYKTYKNYDLKMHMLKHQKPEETEVFQCYHCNFKAKRKDNLKAHIFRHDIYKDLLDCFICSFKTSSRYELKKHVDIHSENQRKEANELNLKNRPIGANQNKKRQRKKLTNKVNGK